MKSSLKYLLFIFLISFILYFPSLFGFYTNDDFFLLKISQANSLGEFTNFFNLTAGPDGLGMYRPLTTQAFYFLSWRLFSLNPIGLHIISFLVFFGVIYLVFKLVLELSKNEKMSLLAAFLYATSATHFGHLYYLATFQELGFAFFFLISVLLFIQFLNTKKLSLYILSLTTFVLSLLSKETAVVLPACLLLVYMFIKQNKKENLLPINRLIVSILPYFLILAFYFYFRFVYYGFATGDSYIWDFSLRRTINTLGWYALWSFNLPEMLVDFVGPGLKFNPNLFKFWSREIIPIFILFGTLLSGITYVLTKNYKKLMSRKSLILILFCISWFVIAISPVLFLPLHKFTFYLTVPLVGISTAVSYLLVSNNKRPVTVLFLAIWVSLSILTLTLTSKTNWITKGQETAKRVHNYLIENESVLEKYKTIVFYDTEEDKDLPWRPSEVLRVVLSEQNYFKIFWNDKFTVKYYTSENETKEVGVVKIRARKFLGY